jgi:hypothetical protein
VEEREYISAKFEALDARLSEYIRRIDENIDHTGDMTLTQIETGRKETEMLVETNREKTEMLIQSNQGKTEMLLEANREKTEMLIEANREKTELLLEANRNETILKIETSKRETDILIRAIKESTERTEMRFREDNEKAEARIERLARELKDSNNRIQGYTLANIVGFAAMLIAIAVLVWSIKTIEFPAMPAPTVNINQQPSSAVEATPPSGQEYNYERRR